MLMTDSEGRDRRRQGGWGCAGPTQLPGLTQHSDEPCRFSRFVYAPTNGCTWLAQHFNSGKSSDLSPSPEALSSAFLTNVPAFSGKFFLGNRYSWDLLLGYPWPQNAQMKPHINSLREQFLPQNT